MAHITLVNLNMLFVRYAESYEKELHLPLGPLYLTTVLEDNGVDRLQRLRVLGQGVEVRDHVLLARMGDVDAAEAGAARTGEQVADDALADLEQPVGVVELELGGRTLVQRRAERRTDPPTDQSHLVPHNVRTSTLPFCQDPKLRRHGGRPRTPA